MADASGVAVTAMPPSRGTAGRRAGLVTLDQVISSASNLLVLIWVAHALSPADFGRFSLVFLAYVFAQSGLVRALVAATVVVHPEDADERSRSVLGAGLLLSLAAGVVCILAGAVLWATGSVLAAPVLLVGVLMPLLGVQDVGRYIGIAESRPGRAIVLDTMWLVLMVAAFLVVGAVERETLTWLVAAWAVSGAVSGLWVFAQHGLLGRDDLSLEWLRHRWHFSWRSLVASSSSAAVALLGSMLVSIVSGPIAVAALRAALLLERPSTTVQTAVATSAAADIARERPDNAGLLAHQRRTMALSIGVAVLNMAIVLMIPDELGKLVLGQVWSVVEPLLLVIGFHVGAIAAQSGVRAALMGRRRIETVMVVDIAGTLLAIIGMVAGAAVADAEGAMWGAVVGQAATAVVWWFVFLRHLADTADEAPAVAATPAS